MQVPGPTLIVTEGQTVTVPDNNLPTAAGNTSILFPGFNVTRDRAASHGLLTQEAAPGGTVTYTFTATTPGTHAYYSGTQGDLQVEMGLYGAIIVLPSRVPAACTSGRARQRTWPQQQPTGAKPTSGWQPRPTTTPSSLLRPRIPVPVLRDGSQHSPPGEAQVTASSALHGRTLPGCSSRLPTEPYHPAYFMINGRSMPDDMDPNYAAQYPHQPYNGNPHMHPGELVLLRIIGQGRWQHPFHEHGNHVRILARDGNLILSATDCRTNLAGPLLFTTTTTPGLAMDGIFYWTGKGLNWDAVRPQPGLRRPDARSCPAPRMQTATTPAQPDRDQLLRVVPGPQQAAAGAPFGDVAGGGPVTLPDPNIFANGAWYGGSPYLGPDATVACGRLRPARLRPPGTIANSPDERSRLRLHVALAQRARDHHQQYLPGRNDDDDAGRFPGIS